MLSVTHFLLLYDSVWVTFLEAIRKGKWIRRRNSSRNVCVSDTPTHLYSITRSDFLAEDWEIIEFDDDPEEPKDGSSTRFSLLELE